MFICNTTATWYFGEKQILNKLQISEIKFNAKNGNTLSVTISERCH